MKYPCLSIAVVSVWIALSGAEVSAAPDREVNVRDKGAKCDGVSDDSAAFNAAAAAASPAKGGLGILFVPPSDTPCRLGSPLVLQSGETIYAQPGTVTIAPLLPYLDPTRAPLLLSIKEASHVTVRGLSFDGELERVGTSGGLITVYGADHVLFDHIAVRNARGIALSFSGGPRGVTYSGLQDSSFDNGGTYYLESTDKKADRKQAVAFCCGTRDGGGVWSNQHNFARSSHWGDNGFDNLSIGQQSWFTAADNVFKGTRNGANIYCSHDSHIRIVNNTTSGASGNGIDCFINDDLTITGNESSMNGAAGIQADGTQCGLIAGNTTSGNFQSVAATWLAGHPGSTPSQHRGGITIGGGLKEDTQGTDDVVISRNESGDTQRRPTQAYGILVLAKAQVHNLRVTPDNRLAGNSVAAFGGQISRPTAAADAAPGCKLWGGED